MGFRSRTTEPSSYARRAGPERAAHRIAQRDGHRVDRPVGVGTDTRFRLTYVRTGPRGRVPVLILPGGPGLASAVPYRRIRALAARDGLDVIMMEHRGVGLSRRDEHGHDLPGEAVTIERVVDDIAAILDHAGVPRAVVYGSSYGTYLAQGFGVRHPARVAGMILDSPMLSVEQDLEMVRAHRRRLFLEGSDPGLARVAAAVREAIDAGLPQDEISEIVQITYEFAGPDVLCALSSERARGRLRRTWHTVSRLGRSEVGGAGVPYYAETDLVRGIMYRELGFGLPVDGEPLDPQSIFAAAGPHPPFVAEPFDLPSRIVEFTWPTAVLSGERDLRTPRPVAERIVDLVPGAVLVPVAGMGHSALDTHQLVAVRVSDSCSEAVTARGFENLHALAPMLSRLPKRGMSNTLGRSIAAAVGMGRRAGSVAALIRPGGS
ncbi:alpha/beta hydrolase [Rhodococcus artemisiae]|uniref:Alpha/beta hydrolase n=1 Tax=Rhodococcus artemisiae TaxID=714159 RepID=A0ABU7LDB4_9NOCA|nr:alpha/beta hydrolase [Rhodococcus artemisiae]